MRHSWRSIPPFFALNVCASLVGIHRHNSHDFYVTQMTWRVKNDAELPLITTTSDTISTILGACVMVLQLWTSVICYSGFRKQNYRNHFLVWGKIIFIKGSHFSTTHFRNAQINVQCQILPQCLHLKMLYQIPPGLGATSITTIEEKILNHDVLGKPGPALTHVFFS